MKTSKIIVWSISILVAGYFIFVMVLVFTPHIRDYFNRTEFNSEKWKSWEESESELALRWDMITDLKTDYKLVGMTKKEIVNLLGEPDDLGKDYYSYYLGLLGIDTGRLVLNFKDGVVVKYEKYRG